MLGIDLEIAISKTASIGFYVFVFSLLLALIVCLMLKLQGTTTALRTLYFQTFFISFTFGILAIVTGFLTATSRETAIANVIPAVLTLIGGLALYIVDKGQEKFLVTGISVLSFSMMLFMGAALGSFERQKGEAQAKSPTMLRKAADIEFAINSYRRSLGLQPISLSEFSERE